MLFAHDQAVAPGIALAVIGQPVFGHFPAQGPQDNERAVAFEGRSLDDLCLCDRLQACRLNTSEVAGSNGDLRLVRHHRQERQRITPTCRETVDWIEQLHRVDWHVPGTQPQSDLRQSLAFACSNARRGMFLCCGQVA